MAEWLRSWSALPLSTISLCNITLRVTGDFFFRIARGSRHSNPPPKCHVIQLRNIKGIIGFSYMNFNLIGYRDIFNYVFLLLGLVLVFLSPRNGISVKTLFYNHNILHEVC
jgi:hypothetical protein